MYFIKLKNRLYISPLFLILFIAAFCGKFMPYFIIAYSSALIHEICHILAAKRLGIPISHIEILPFGICGRLGTEFIKSPKYEFLIAIVGPMCSGCLAFIFFVLSMHLPFDMIKYAKDINIALCVLNLFPTLPLDGGRMLKAVLSEALGILRAYNIMIKLSRILIIFIISLSIVLLISRDFNFSLIMIGAFLLGSLSSEQKTISQISLKQILYHKNKLSELGLCRSERFVAKSKTPARHILKRMSSHKYYIIDVVDEKNGRIIKSVTETTVLDALINKSIRITFGDV